MDWGRAPGGSMRVRVTTLLDRILSLSFTVAVKVETAAACVEGGAMVSLTEVVDRGAMVTKEGAPVRPATTAPLSAALWSRSKVAVCPAVTVCDDVVPVKIGNANTADANTRMDTNQTIAAFFIVGYPLEYDGNLVPNFITIGE